MKRIIFTLVSEEARRELLEVVPHRIVCKGIAIVYRYIEDGKFSSVITDTRALELGLTEAQLYEMALVNMKHLLPVLEEESEGVYTLTSLNQDMLGSSMAFMPGMLDQVLNKTGAEQLYVVVDREKATVSTRISSILKRVFGNAQADDHIGRVMRYTQNGFATI